MRRDKGHEEIPASLPDAAASQAPPPGIKPFPADAVGIVVAGPPETAEVAGQLCERVQTAGARRVSCVAHTTGHDPARSEAEETTALSAQARAAGTKVLVKLASDRTALVSVIGATERDDLLRDLLGGDVPRVSTSSAGLAPSVYALSLLAAWGTAPLDPGLCPRLDQNPIDRLSLVVNLLAPSCTADAISAARLDALCGASSAKADLSCALARVLYAERPSTALEVRVQLKNMLDLLDHAPAPFQRVARVKLARYRCEAEIDTPDDIESAGAALEELAAGAAGCDKVTLAPVAACLLAKVSSMKGAAVGGVLREIEASALKDADCPHRPTIARALGERAYWRGRGGRWKEAGEDYEEAYGLLPDLRYALSRVEGLLHEKRPRDALKRLDELRNEPAENPTDAMYRALLRWVAAREAKEPKARTVQEAKDLVSLYAAKVDAGVVPFPEEDKALRALVCPDGAAAPCAYDELTGQRGDDPVKELERRLKLAGGR